MGYLSNIKKQYWISLFFSLVPAYVIERLFNQERGITVQMVVYCEIIYALTITVLEIPSGILADKFGRKRMLILNSALAVAEFIILLSARSFWQFALVTFLSGIGKAFSSGSENALLYDSLAAHGKEGDFEKLLGRLSAIDFIGSLIAALCGGVLAGIFSYEFNYVVSACSMLIAFSITLTLKEPPMLTKPENETMDALQHTKKAMLVFRSQPLVLIYCLTGAVLGACMIYLDEFWQVALNDVGVSVAYFGAFSALIMLARTPGSLFAYKLKGAFSYKRVLTWVTLLSAVGYLAVFFTRSAWCILPMGALALMSGVADPLVAGYLHHHTESHIRATVESFSSLGLRAISIVVGLVFGWISAQYSVFVGFTGLGLICLALSGFFSVKMRSQ